MKKKRVTLLLSILAGVGIGTGIYKRYQQKKSDEKKEKHIPYGFYEAVVKRPLDVVLAGTALIILLPVMLFTAALVRFKLGSPVLFVQERPGLHGEIFTMFKFRTMTDKRGDDGELLPDSERLTSFGKFLRSTSLDELPELFNILQGDMSIVGPRPQLVRDMVFMSEEHKRRHAVMPGLTGLAQVNGRNDIDWEEKLDYDLEYASHITFLGDLKIVLKTVEKVFVSKEGITETGMATATDYGDYLLERGRVSHEEYEMKQKQAKELLEGNL